MDNAEICSSCQKRAAVRGWIHLYPTLKLATMSANAADFMGAFIPGPGLIKVEICLSCGRFGQFTEYTEEELAEIKQYGERQQKAIEAGKKFGVLVREKMAGKQP